MPLLTAFQGRGRHRSGHGRQRRICRVHLHAGVDVGPASSSYMRARAESPGPYASSSPLFSACCSTSASSPAAFTAGGVSGRGEKGATGRSSAPPPLAASTASSLARRLSGSRAQLVPAWRSMLYTSPAGHGSPGATWRHSWHSHIHSSTPSALACSPLGSTTPLSIVFACVCCTPRSVPCPTESAPSDSSSLASSVLGATAASACAINSPTSASLPGAACAAPSPPAASRWYASKACASSSLMSRGPSAAASCVACGACTSAVGPPTGGRILHPMGQARTTRYRHGPSRHHGRSPSRHGKLRCRGRLRWRSRCSRSRQGHRQGRRSRLRPRRLNGSRPPCRALGHAVRLPVRVPRLQDSLSRCRY